MGADALCDRLRSLVQDCIAKHVYSSAAFYADKLVTLSDHAPGDVFLLAQTYYISQQYRRANMLLRNHGVMDDMRFRYLAAKCMAQVQDWEECLALLGEGDDEGSGGGGAMQGEDRHPGWEVGMAAAVALLRGQVFEALGNRERARRWYTSALAADPYCEAALAALVGGHLLCGEEELALVEGLALPPVDRWLRLLYRCRCKQYGQAHVMEAQLAELERTYTGTSSSGGGGGDAAPAASGAQPAAPAGAHTQQRHQQQAGTPAVPRQRQPPATPLRTPQPLQPQARPSGGGRSTRSRAKQPHPSQQAPTPATPLSDQATPMNLTDSPDAPDTAAARSHTGAGASGRDAGVGWGLEGNVDVLAARAEWLAHRGDAEGCYRLTAAVLASDPYARELLPAHLAAAVALGRKSDLFLRAHQMVREAPRVALSWYAVGSYYLATRQMDAARRYFARVTQLDRNCAHAWIGLGHAYSCQDESDQAMGAYRTAARLFPGLAMPLLGMGVEYGRMNNAQLAERCVLEAHRLCPNDPAPTHELGVLAFRAGDYEAAAAWLRKALQLAPPARPAAAEPTLVALGHCLRKQRQYGEAVRALEAALALAPAQASTYTALGFTLQLLGDSAGAVEAYHKALGLRPDDAFANDMLAEALAAEALRFDALLGGGEVL